MLVGGAFIYTGGCIGIIYVVDRNHLTLGYDLSMCVAYVIVADVTVSGIMVDGIDAEDYVLLTRQGPQCENPHGMEEFLDCCKGRHSTDEQDFRDAEMVILRITDGSISNHDIDIHGQKEVRQVKHFKGYAVYGDNKVVETIISAEHIKNLKKHTKVIWANQKPYILNGVHISRSKTSGE